LDKIIIVLQEIGLCGLIHLRYESKLLNFKLPESSSYVKSLGSGGWVKNSSIDGWFAVEMTAVKEN